MKINALNWGLLLSLHFTMMNTWINWNFNFNKSIKLLIVPMFEKKMLALCIHRIMQLNKGNNYYLQFVVNNRKFECKRNLKKNSKRRKSVQGRAKMKMCGWECSNNSLPKEYLTLKIISKENRKNISSCILRNKKTIYNFFKSNF